VYHRYDSSLPNLYASVARCTEQVPSTSSSRTVWHLNLLRFSDRAEGETAGAIYQSYGGSGAMGGKDGLLARFGARITMANQCFRSLIGETDFDRAAIAEYPSRESYLTMVRRPAFSSLMPCSCAVQWLALLPESTHP
jgi:hypothetical protein